MLAKRIIPVQLLSGGRLTKTKQFGARRDVGSPLSSSRVYYANGADELIFLNIDRDTGISPLIKVMEEVSQVLFVPLTAGGGVVTEDDAWRLVQAGADKVAINSAAYGDIVLLSRVAQRLGCQAVVASIDVIAAQGRYRTMSNGGSLLENVPLLHHVRRCVKAGAGEILINCIDRDGMMQGYDLDLLRQVIEAAGSVPVVCLGGAGNYAHLAEAFEAGADACAAGSLFNFTDSNPLRAKSYLRNHGVLCRHA